MENTAIFGYAVVTVIALLYIISWFNSMGPNLDFIPAIGPSGRLSSYFGAFQFIFKGHRMVEEGYRKYPAGMFKVPNIDKWVVVLNGSNLVDDLRRARDEELSIFEAIKDGFQMKYNLSLDVGINSYHARTVQSPLTRNLDARFADVHDEIVQAFRDVVCLHDDDWTSLPCFEKSIEVVCRVSHRLFVGLPFCRDREYLDLNINFAVSAFKSAFLINLFPNSLKPIVGPIISPLKKTMRRIGRHLYPIIQERLQKDKEYGKDWPNRPNDLITWLIDESPADSTPYDITMRIQVINFAAIHSASNGFTHALYHLATNPEYIEPLREEVETVVKEGGWTKSSIAKLKKVDSFLRECLRYNGIGCLTMYRKVIKPSGYTFSDGTTLPCGTFVAVPIHATHHDETLYPNADVFDGFRFSNMYDSEGQGTKCQLAATSLDYLAWGYGRHACPGRFFAVNELKTMLAHVVATYDVKLKGDGVFPPNQWFAENCIPNRTAEVMFRRRK